MLRSSQFRFNEIYHTKVHRVTLPVFLPFTKTLSGSQQKCCRSLVYEVSWACPVCCLQSPAFLSCAGSSASALVCTPFRRGGLKLVQYLQPACYPGTRRGMGPGKFRLSFTIDLQPYNIGACTWFSQQLFVEFNCEVTNFLGTKVAIPLSPMPLKKLAGVFLHFEKNYKNKMTMHECGVFLGNSTIERLIGEYLV